MAIRLEEADAASVLHAMEVFTQEWPELNLFGWAGDGSLAEKAAWSADHAHFFTAWDGERLAGYFAAVDLGRGRWSIHFGSRRAMPSGKAMIYAWRKIRALAGLNGVRLIVAYIPAHRPDIERAAQTFKFRKFSKLWALQLPTSNLRPKRPRP